MDRPRNIVGILHWRGLGLDRLEGTARRNLQHQNFSHMAVQDQYDMYHEDNLKLGERFVKFRSVKMVCHQNGVILVLAESGLLMAFNQYTKKRFCTLNHTDEDIQMIFWNNVQSSVILFSHSPNMLGRQVASCTSIALEDLEMDKFFKRYDIFITENLRRPSDVKICSENGKAVVLSSGQHRHGTAEVMDDHIRIAIYNLGDYELIHLIQISPPLRRIQIEDTIFTGYNISQGLLIVYCKKIVKGKFDHHVIELFSLETAKSIARYTPDMDIYNGITHVQILGNNLFVQQRDKTMAMLSFTDSGLERIKTFGPLTTKVTFLQRLNLLVMGSEDSCFVHNSNGDLVHRVAYPQTWKLIKYVVSKDDSNVLISYCQAAEGSKGIIFVNNILTGDKIAELSDKTERAWSPADRDVSETSSRALTDVTEVSYSEESYEIFTGTAEGLIYRWGN